jgi:hypothetical protein
MNKASFSLYSPQGVRTFIEGDGGTPHELTAAMQMYLDAGFTVQEPVPEAGEKRYRITRYTKSHQKMDNGDALPVLNLWSDNGEYPQLSVWPTTYREDGTQIVADIEHMFDMTVPLCDVTMRDKVPGKAWGHCDMVAIGVPETDMNGEPKTTKGGHIKYRFHHIEGAGTNGTGPKNDDRPRTWQTWGSKQDAIDWSVESGASTNEHSAENAMDNAVMQVLGDKNARPENKQQAHAIFQAFYFERMERLNSRMEEEAQPEQELPF